MQIYKIERFLLRIEYLLGAAIIIFQLFGRNSLTSLFFYATFFVSLALWITTLFDRFSPIDAIGLLVIVLAVSNLIINGLLNEAHFSFEYLKKFIMFSCTIFYLSAAVKIPYGETTNRFLELVFLFIGMTLGYMYFTHSYAMHLIDGVFSSYLTFRFTNPNLTALFLTCLIMLMMISALKEKSMILRILLFGMSAAESVFLWETKSRNAMLTMAVFLLVYFLFLLLRNRNWKIPKWILAVTSVFPIIFAYIYLQVINSKFISSVLSFIISEGKGLDARLIIWQRGFEYTARSPLFGAYYEISEGAGYSQMHNSHIDIMASYGVLTLIITCAFLYLVMKQVQQRNSDYTQTIALAGFACSLLLGVGEAAMFSGGLAIYLYAGAFLFLSNSAEKPWEDTLLLSDAAKIGGAHEAYVHQ